MTTMTQFLIAIGVILLVAIAMIVVGWLLDKRTTRRNFITRRGGRK